MFEWHGRPTVDHFDLEFFAASGQPDFNLVPGLPLVGVPYGVCCSLGNTKLDLPRPRFIEAKLTAYPIGGDRHQIDIAEIAFNAELEAFQVCPFIANRQLPHRRVSKTYEILCSCASA